jgi:hypothetical protein
MDNSVLIAFGVFGSLALSLYLLAKGRVELWILVTFLIVICMLVFHSNPPVVTVHGVSRANG